MRPLCVGILGPLRCETVCTRCALDVMVVGCKITRQYKNVNLQTNCWLIHNTFALVIYNTDF